MDVATFATFLDKKHVLVLASKRLVCWELPSCREIYAIATDAQPCLSPQRTQMNRVARQTKQRRKIRLTGVLRRWREPAAP